MLGLYEKEESERETENEKRMEGKESTTLTPSNTTVTTPHTKTTHIIDNIMKNKAH